MQTIEDQTACWEDITHAEKLGREDLRGELGASKGSKVALFQNYHLPCFKKYFTIPRLLFIF